VNRRTRRRSAIILATAALTAAVGAFKPFDRRAASKAFDEGVAAARANDASGAAQAFEACLGLRPAREDCQAGLALAKRALLAEESARRATARSSRPTTQDLIDQSLAMLQSSAPEAPGGPTVDPVSEEDKRRAIIHWNEGIKYFQANDYSRARDEWLLCLKFDPACDECMQGLKRLDATFGGGR
jgi:tetratricopeptide (TPR) repeat protein